MTARTALVIWLVLLGGFLAAAGFVAVIDLMTLSETR